MPTPNVIQIRDNQGNAVYPITDKSLVIGLQDAPFEYYIVAWDGASSPVVANIPAGVVVNYDGTDYTGTLAASATTAPYLYLVASASQQGEYDRYIVTHPSSSYVWTALGSTAPVSPVIADDLNTNDASKALSAKQGKILGDSVSQLEHEIDEKLDGVAVNNPEWAFVFTDRDDKILAGIKKDCSIEWAIGIPTPVKDYVAEEIEKIVSGGTGTSINDLDKIVDFLTGFSTSETLSGLLATKVDKDAGKSLINADYAASMDVVDNPEWRGVATDSEGRVLVGIKTDGSFKWNKSDAGIIVDSVVDITTELQQRCNDGGTINIIGSGIAIISDTIIIKKNNTHIVVDDGITMQWSKYSYGCMMRTIGGAVKWDNPLVGQNMVDNISIQGGTWDLGGSFVSSSSVPGFIIADATNVTIKNMIVKNAFKFFFGFGNIDRFDISNITLWLDNTAILGKDGLHFAGGVRNGIIYNIRGNTTDDLVALNFGGDVEGDDTTNAMIRMGDSYNVSVKNIYMLGAHEAIRLLAEDRYKCTDIHIDGVFGYTDSPHCISINAWKYTGHQAVFGNLTIENVFCRISAIADNPIMEDFKNPIIIIGNPWSGIQPCVIESLIIRNLVCKENESVYNTPVQIAGISTVKYLLLENLRTESDSSVELTGHAIIEIGTGNDASRLDNVVLSSCYNTLSYDSVIKINNQQSSVGQVVNSANILTVPIN